MDVTQIESGLWRWTAYHDEWREDVGSVFLESDEGVVLVDPLVPPDDTERFWRALDRDVRRAGRHVHVHVHVHVLVTVFWHVRSTKAIVERYAARVWAPSTSRAAVERRAGTVTDVFRPGDRLPGGIEAFRSARRTEVVFWIPQHRALVPGDVLLGDGAGGVRMCPESWLPGTTGHRELAESLRPLLDLPVRRVLVSHGTRFSPADDGSSRPPWVDRRLGDAVLWLWILIGVVALVAVFAVVGYNRLVRLRNEVDTGWANIDVQLQRRADLIPNLVETVRAYAAHERGVFEQVTRARAALQQAGTPGTAAEANEGLTVAIGRLFAVAEAYPELRASENFLQLQEDLTDTEDKISAARRYYNATVMRFNTGVQSFPWLLVASLLGFRAREFFSARGDTAVPQVSLAT